MYDLARRAVYLVGSLVGLIALLFLVVPPKPTVYVNLEPKTCGVPLVHGFESGDATNCGYANRRQLLVGVGLMIVAVGWTAVGVFVVNDSELMNRRRSEKDAST